MKNVFKLVLPLIALLAFACTNDSESDLLEPIPENSGDNDDAIITFTADVQPITTRNCLGCHSSPPRNGAPFSLVTFQQVRSRSNAILRAISMQTGEPGAMPPSGRIPQASIDIIEQWIQDGLEE